MCFHLWASMPHSLSLLRVMTTPSLDLMDTREENVYQYASVQVLRKPDLLLARQSADSLIDHGGFATSHTISEMSKTAKGSQENITEEEHVNRMITFI